MKLLEAIIYGLPLLCGKCGCECESVDCMGYCRDCHNEYARERKRKRKAVGA